MAIEACVRLDRFEDALDTCERYGDDAMPDTLYGRALALFRLGRRREANLALRTAIKYVPLVKKELLESKHRVPRTATPGMITMGGADEAYSYWQHWGSLWQEDPKALEWLRGMTGVVKARGKGR